MTQDTQSKFAAILAAAQNKVNQQWQPIPQPKPQPIKQPVQQPELSTITIDDILSERSQVIAEETIKIIADEQSEAKRNAFDVVNYSDKAIAVFGNTKAIKEDLKAFGGRFNPFLNYNGNKAAGWIFSKTKETQLRNFINSLN